MSSIKKNRKSVDMTQVEIQQNNWWEDSVVEFAFNIPCVRVNLEKLMGTNVIQLTDPAFMMRLRQRLWDDGDKRMIKNIEERKMQEIEREKQLILKGIYTHYNRPKQLIPLHSIVLALDLGNRAHLITKKTRRNQRYESIVFKINQRTNTIITDRRLKMDSIRQKNVEHLIRQTKLEGIKPNIEYDKLIAIESKIKEIEERILGAKSKKIKI